MNTSPLKLLFVSLIVLFAVTNALELRFTSENEFCPQQDKRTDEEVAIIVKAIRQASNEDERIEVLTKTIVVSPKGFETEHVMQIVSQFGFIKGRTASIALMNPYLLRFTCSDIVSILRKFSFTSEKFEVLEVLKDTMIDNQNKEEIVNEFGFSSDKDKARKMLEGVKNRNCIYGTIGERTCTFLVDVSGSMEAKFEWNGKRINRLDMVKEQLKLAIRDQLQTYQRFNIYAFQSRVSAFRRNVVNATEDNVVGALKWIDTLRPYGGTNIYQALLDSYRNVGDDLEGIYLLSDGLPTQGVTDRQRILNNIDEMNSQREKPVVIHTTAFLMGNHRTDDKPESRLFMYQIAKLTNGVYRNIDNE